MLNSKRLLLTGRPGRSQHEAKWVDVWTEHPEFCQASLRGMNVDTLCLHRIGRANFNKGEEAVVNETEKQC